MQAKVKIDNASPNRNGRKYLMSREVIEAFLRKPEAERVVTLGFPHNDPSVPDTPEEIRQKAGIGVVTGITESDSELFMEMTLDPSVDEQVAKMFKNGVHPTMSLGGHGYIDPDGTVRMTSIEHTVMMPPKADYSPEVQALMDVGFKVSEDFVDSSFSIWDGNPRPIRCVRNDKNHGWRGDDKQELVVGNIYKLVKVEVHGSYTLVWVEGISHPFNSVLFNEV